MNCPLKANPIIVRSLRKQSAIATIIIHHQKTFFFKKPFPMSGTGTGNGFLYQKEEGTVPHPIQKSVSAFWRKYVPAAIVTACSVH